MVTDPESLEDSTIPENPMNVDWLILGFHMVGKERGDTRMSG
jgi:hypothetical protein